MNNINIRYYKNGDSIKIYTLFSNYSTYKRDAEFWVWINRLLSKEDSIIAVAVNDNDEIVGHYGILPFSINLNGSSIKVGLGLHAFVSPEYRNKVSIFQISQYAYDLAKKFEIKLIYGFPNLNYRLIQERLEKWMKVSLFKAFNKDINDFSIMEMNFQLDFIDCNDNHSDFFKLNDLIENNKCFASIKIEKNLNYFINRYLRHPQNLYINKLIKYDNQIIGFITFKVYKQDFTNLHILDFLITDYKYLPSILIKSASEFIDLDKMVLWPVNMEFKKLLEDIGFNQSGFETFFGIKFLDESLPNDIKNKLLIFENWELQMGDSDAF